jgi:hypothetical protein
MVRKQHFWHSFRYSLHFHLGQLGAYVAKVLPWERMHINGITLFTLSDMAKRQYYPEQVQIDTRAFTFSMNMSLSWNKALISGLRPDLYYCQTVAGLLSDERMGLSFTMATGPRQRSHSPVRVPRDS